MTLKKKFFFSKQTKEHNNVKLRYKNIKARKEFFIEKKLRQTVGF